jgi:hypothetical protein
MSANERKKVQNSKVPKTENISAATTKSMLEVKKK